MTARKLRIGIYGGAFDPVHFGHLLLAESARQQMELDEVIFVPTGRPPHKDECKLTDARHRVKMLELAIRGNPFFRVDRFEVDSAEVSYTLHTVTHFARQNPGAKLFLLLGEDMLRDFPFWYRPAEICRKVTPLVIGRAGSEVKDLAFLEGIVSAKRMAEIEKSRVRMIPVGFSSSEIREMAAAGKSISYQTPAAVVEYIRKKGLYAENDF